MNKTMKLLIPMLVFTFVIILSAGTILFVSKSKNHNFDNQNIALAETQFEPYTADEKNNILNLINNTFDLDGLGEYKKQFIESYLINFEEAEIEVNSVEQLINTIDNISKIELSIPHIDVLSINSILNMLSDVATFNKIPNNLHLLFETGATNNQLAEVIVKSSLAQIQIVANDTVPLYQKLLNSYDNSESAKIKSAIYSTLIDILPSVEELINEKAQTIEEQLVPVITNALNISQALIYFYKQTPINNAFDVINAINAGIKVDAIDEIASKASALADKIESYSTNGVYVSIDNEIMKTIYSLSSKISLGINFMGKVGNYDLSSIKNMINNIPNLIYNSVTLINDTINSTVQLLRSFENEIKFVNKNGEMQTIKIGEALNIVAQESLNGCVNYENLGIILSNVISNLPYKSINNIANSLIKAISNVNDISCIDAYKQVISNISRYVGMMEGISKFKNIPLNYKNNEETAKNVDKYLTFSFSYVNIDGSNTVENICFADYIYLLENSIENITNYNLLSLVA